MAIRPVATPLPFWHALDLVLDAADLDINFYGGGEGTLLLQKREKHRPSRVDSAAYAGVYRIEPTSITARRNLSNPDLSGLNVSIHIAWQPTTTPIGLTIPVAQLSGRLDDSAVLKPQASGDTIDVATNRDLAFSEFFLPMQLPADQPRKISSLSGLIQAMLPGKQESFELSLGETATAKTVDALTVTVEEVRQNGPLHEIRLGVELKDADRSLESHRHWIFENDAYVQRKDGSRADHLGYQVYRQTASGIGLSYLFDLGDTVGESTLIYTSPTAVIQNEVPFVIQDIPAAMNSDVSMAEKRSVAWATAWFFFILLGYLVIRPVRDALGSLIGTDGLQVLMWVTLGVMLLVVPAYSWLVAKLPRRWLVRSVYHCFTACLILFYGLMQIDSDAVQLWTSRLFFVWVNVFALFATSVFWSVLADLFNNQQGKRLFGIVAAGGTAGAVTGSLLTTQIVDHVSTAGLLLIPAATLQAGLACAWRLEKSQLKRVQPSKLLRSTKSTSGVWSGITAVLGVSLPGFHLSVPVFSFRPWGTQLYFQQAEIVADVFETKEQRVQFFASLDLGTQLLTLVIQTVAAGWVLRRWGVAVRLGRLAVGVLRGSGGVGGIAGVVGSRDRNDCHAKCRLRHDGSRSRSALHGGQHRPEVQVQELH